MGERREVKVVTPIPLKLNISRDRWRHVIPKGQGRDLDIFEAQYLDNRARYMFSSYWLPIGNHTLGIQWSHDRWRHVTPKVNVVPQYLCSLISQKPCEIDGRFKWTTHRKPHIANPMVTWQMTSPHLSRDPKRSRSWPRYLWSSISRQPCELHGRFILTTNRKPHLGNLLVTWPMTSRDPTVFLYSKFSTLIRSRGCSIEWCCQNCSEALENCLFCTCALKYGEKTKLCRITKISALLIENQCRPNCNKTANINAQNCSLYRC